MRDSVYCEWGIKVSFRSGLDGKGATDLIRDAKHDDGASVVVVEIDPFRHLASSDRQENSAAAVVAGLHVLCQLPTFRVT